MAISSSIPAVSTHACPVCRSTITLSACLPFGDAPCPTCGNLLWFLSVDGELRFFPPDETEARREKVIELIAERVGLDKELVRADPKAFFKELAQDSLDTMELVIALEDEFSHPAK